MAYDPFSSIARGDISPSLSGLIDYNIPIVPNDVAMNVLDKDGQETVAVAVYVEVEGVVSYLDRHGKTRSIRVPALTWMPIMFKRINATGTTATGISAGIMPR